MPKKKPPAPAQRDQKGAGPNLLKPFSKDDFPEATGRKEKRV